MLLRNYDNIVVAKTSIGANNVTIKTGDEFTDGQINVKRIDGSVSGIPLSNSASGRCCPLAQFGTAQPGSIINAVSYSWFVIGSGNTKESYDDYALEAEHSNASFSCDTSSLIEGELKYDLEKNAYSKTISCSFLAKVDSTVGEIGVKNMFGNTTAYICLVYRKALETPISVLAGQYITVSLTTTVYANSNKPADYQATVSVE